MACLIIAESAIFTIFVVAYLFYMGKSLTGPTPREVLETPIFYTICLLSSSLTIHFAAKFLERGRRGAFLLLWLLTIVLGGLFLYGTGQEWHRLIYEHGLTISTNLFGTTYYSLVGLHAFHVIVGLAMLAHRADLRPGRPRGPEQSASRGRAFDVLAFCRCRVDRRFHRCLRNWSLRRRNGNAADNRTEVQSARRPGEIEVPASTAWPFVLAFGFTLMFAGPLTMCRSASSAPCLLLRVASAGSAKCFLTSTKKLCR